MERWKEAEYGYEYRASVIAVCCLNPHLKEGLPLDHFIRPFFKAPSTTTEVDEEARQQNIINVMQACGLKLETITEGMD